MDMQIRIDFCGEQIGVAIIPGKDGKTECSLGDLATGMLTAFSGVFKDFMKKYPPETDDDMADTYDSLTYLFNLVLNDLFPDIKPLAFELSDAAVLYAQDQIVNEAYEKGITFDEAIAEFEKKAKEYVDARKMS